jgi:hypothetical protein
MRLERTLDSDGGDDGLERQRLGFAVSGGPQGAPSVVCPLRLPPQAPVRNGDHGARISREGALFIP